MTSIVQLALNVAAAIFLLAVGAYVLQAVFDFIIDLIAILRGETPNDKPEK